MPNQEAKLIWIMEQPLKNCHKKRIFGLDRLRDGFRRDTWQSRFLISILVIPFMTLYPITNILVGHRGFFQVWQFSIDAWIPFNRFFIIPYFYWYVQVAAGILMMVFSKKSGRLIYRHVMALCLASLIANLIFIVFPTHVPRPVLEGQDILTSLVLLIYKIDSPYNCFPSMHVCYAVLTASAWYLAGPRRWWFWLVNLTGTTLICLSTVFTKQHYSPDILGGLLLAGIAWLLADLICRRTGLLKPVPETGCLH
ncbi:MAG: phosphatase PAP2 family protein [Clostridiaceae bacterium]|nr:phosphatase PAP2 family protein [Clostridiaceae bacterium]